MASPNRVQWYVPIGSTFEVTLRYRDQETSELIDLTGLKCRMTVRESVIGAVVVELTSDAGDIELAAAGDIAITMNSQQSAAAGPDNTRRELKFSVELFDDSVSPEYVKTLITVGDLVMVPVVAEA